MSEPPTMNSLSTPAQVFWGQGAFLAPQHLQRQDAFHVAYAHALHRLSHPFAWGFERLALREEGLGSGVFDVQQFSLITRDGVRIHGGHAAPGNGQISERNLSQLPVASSDPVSVYLVLPRETTVDTLARTETGRLPARHRLDGGTLADPYDPQAAPAEVQFLHYQVSVLTSLDENAAAVLQTCEAFKAAELVPSGPGRYKLSPDYIPPSVCLQPGHNLLRWTRNFRDLLLSKAQDFSAIKRQRGIRAASTSAQETMRVVMMQTFARYLPLFQEALRLQHPSPYLLYQSLRTLVAEFSVFSEEIGYFGGLRSEGAESELPAYDHEDLRRCFRSAYARAELLVKALTVGAEVGITLAHDGRVYKADMPENLFKSDKTRFYLAIESEFKGQDLAQRLTRTGKICTVEEMPRLLQAALFGLKIDLLPVPPEELPQKTPNTTYFAIDTTHAFWKMIRQRENIAVYSDLPPSSTVMKIYPVGGEE
jgi:type VI secretion system ImpJ/VasE family protein